MTNNIPFISIFLPLVNLKKRYKALYGGRGGGKSWAIAIALLILGRLKKLRILCTREIQGSIKDSVHKLLSDIINKYELKDYTIQKDSIFNTNTGTKFIFKGLHTNAAEIKSTEGIDICWVEEAQSVSAYSLEILIPTIRKEGSEVWFSFNRFASDDPVYKRFVKSNRKDVWILKVLYSDNPKLPETLKKEAEYDKQYDYEYYLHVWLGEPVAQLERAVIGRIDIQQAIDRVVEAEGKTVIGCDVARYGNDKTTIYKRKGLKVTEYKEYKKQSVTDTARAIMDIATKEDEIRIDDTGVGGGVTDILKDKGYQVIAVNFGAVALDTDKYVNKISEMWFNVAEKIKEADIPDDSELKQELEGRLFKYDNKERKVIEKKDEYKKRIGRSPDKADGFILCYAEVGATVITDNEYIVDMGKYINESTTREEMIY